MQFIKQYDQLWEAFIRPQRYKYQIEQLGLKLQKLHNQLIIRKDLFLFNNKFEKLECRQNIPNLSHFQFIEDNGSSIITPIIIYLHCNGGNRLEALPLLSRLAKHKIQLFCFDFAGCGNSEGEYISLGTQESEDLQIIIKYQINIKQNLLNSKNYY